MMSFRKFLNSKPLRFFGILILLLFSVAVIIATFFVVTNIPNKYFAEPITGMVTDRDTGLPIKGAAVLVIWHSQQPDFHSANRRYFDEQETKTDSNGSFTIPGWPAQFIESSSRSFADSEPEIWIYKFGYIPKLFLNSPSSYRQTSLPFTTVKMFWNSSDRFSLEGANEIQNEYTNDFILGRGLPIQMMGCSWKKRINFLLEMDKQFEVEEQIRSAKNRDHTILPPEDRTKKITEWFINQRSMNDSECPEIINILKLARQTRSKQST